MKQCKTLAMCVCLFWLASVPSYCQRGTFGIDVGQSSDKFGALSAVDGLVVGIDGKVIVLKSNPKKGGPNIVAGGEIRLPTDTQNHAKEYAIFGGPEFLWRNWTIGAHAQIRKIYLPPAHVDNQIFVRDKLQLLEIPLIVRYSFGSEKRAYIQAEGAPEFTPHYRKAGSLAPLPNPNFDHGYFVRGTVGYTFGKYYAKASYETRYFKFVANQNNPLNLYNWRSNLISGGVGFVF
jgi:hypothetical protein